MFAKVLRVGLLLGSLAVRLSGEDLFDSRREIGNGDNEMIYLLWNCHSVPTPPVRILDVDAWQDVLDQALVLPLLVPRRQSQGDLARSVLDQALEMLDALVWCSGGCP